MLSDRSIIKECIYEAYLHLLEEKQSDNISITEITERAGVSRVSYYRNYSSKLDIINDYLKDYVESYNIKNNVSQNVDDFNQHLYHILDICKENKRLFKILFKLGIQLNTTNAIIEKTFYYVEKRFKSKLTNPNKYNLCFYAGAIIFVLNEWLSNDCKEPIEEIYNIIINNLK